MEQENLEPEDMEQEINDPENVEHQIKEQDAMEPENTSSEDEDMDDDPIEDEKDSTLKFIEAVKEHKCIWDMQSEEYYNRSIYRRAWRALLPPSEAPARRQRLDPDQKAELKQKVAELQKVWVDLRDSYYKNEDPGRKYKDSLRFLHTAFQSREMEALLEFDEPSWDLMDVRTWKVKKLHIPRNARITDPSPEYIKARLIKKPRLSYFENLAVQRARLNAIRKQKTIDEESVTGPEGVIDTENPTDTKYVTRMENATDNQIETGVKNVTGIEKMAGIESMTENQMETGAEKNTGIEKMVGIESTSDNQMETGAEKVTDLEKVPGLDKMAGIETATENQMETGVEKETGINKVADIEDVTDNLNANGIENATINQIVTDLEKMIKENASNMENVTDKKNDIGVENETDKKKTTRNKNATGAETTNGKETVRMCTHAVCAERKPEPEPLSILEKAMRLYELENPGEWSSDEDETAKASRTYATITTQTDETEEFPNMPIPTEINEEQ